jgi:hypothetical protein
MKQGGLWVCVSKTVCGFLGMHVYQKKGRESRRVHGRTRSPPTSLSMSVATLVGSVTSRFNSYLSLLYALCKHRARNMREEVRCNHKK